MIKSLALFSFLTLIIACGSHQADPALLFDISLDENKTQFQQNEAVRVQINNKKNKSIEAVTYYIDDKVLPVKDHTVVFDMKTLGNKTLKAVIEFEDTSVEVYKKIKVLAEKAPEIYTYDIVNIYPHDTNAYTQGLEFYQDTLYESTGKLGRSTLRKVDYKSGKILKKIDLDDAVFGEGMTILNGKIYQLTWKSKIGYIYDLKDFKKIDNFQYGESKVGWGLANDGTKLFKSDGTERIWFLNPETLVEQGHIDIVTNSAIFNKANELEYVNGKLFANVYQKPSMMILDASSGAIEGVVNFSGLLEKVTKTENWDAVNNVLNGIAYHPTKKTFFVTGKDWDKLFEVTIRKK